MPKGGQRPGAGRKRLPEARKKSVRIAVSLSPRDAGRLRRAAAARKLKTAAFVRRLIEEFLDRN